MAVTTLQQHIEIDRDVFVITSLLLDDWDLGH
jgi:hypothetical protein